MHDGFVIVDALGIHLDVNPAFCAMTGYSREELLGSNPRDRYWPPGDAERILATFSRPPNGRISDVELQFMRKNGERFPVTVNSFAIRDMAGTILFHAATVKETTQRLNMQSALRNSEARYRALFEHAGDAIVIIEDEQIIDCNELTLELFGVTRSDIMSIPTADFFPSTQPNGQDSREFFSDRIDASRAGKVQIFEWTGNKVDGAELSIEVHMSSFMIGERVYTQAIVRDITQRKRLEDALRLSEEQYRGLFESAGDGILIMQGERVLDCNERVLELYGISREALLNLSNYSLSPPRQPNGQDSQEFFAQRIAALQSENPQIFQWIGKKLDGTPIETEVTLTTFMLDGKPCTQSIIRDTTRRRQLEDALRDSEVRFRTLFESAGDAIAIHKNSRTVDCNERLCELYDLTREEILSARTGDFFPPTQPNGQDSREFFQEKVRASRSGIPQIYEWHGRKRDGIVIITEITLTTFTIGGDIYEQAIARDITQRKRMEAALHDLNRTLEERVLRRTEELERANSELMQRNLQYRVLAKKLMAVEESERRRIAQLLHDSHQQLIVAAKYRAEMLQGDAYAPEVNDVGRQVSEILAQALEATRSLTMELAPPILYGVGLVVALEWLARWMQEHHNLDVVVNGTLPMTKVPTDVSSLLFQSVRELLLNVIKHAGVKQATVFVALDNQQLSVVVTDEGVGFDVATVRENARSFGLFSIQERVASLDGRLDIVSVPGRGTTSTLTIPLAPAHAPQPEPVVALRRSTDQNVAPARVDRGSIRILIVDDHAGARDGLAVMLDLMSDFQIVGQAVDGLDAVEKTHALRPDVILMDVTMPRMNGIDATRRITSEFRDVKIIGFSMHEIEDMLPRMTDAGAIAYLQKTVPVEDLISTIRDVMNRTATAPDQTTSPPE